MTNTKRYTLEIVAAVLGTILMVFPIFGKYPAWVGYGLSLMFFYLRRPFHNKEPKAYPKWFGFLVFAFFVAIIAGIFSRSAILRPVVHILYAGLIGSYCYFDYFLVKGRPHLERR